MSASHPSEAATRVTVGDHTFFPDNAARDLEAMAYEYETNLRFKLDSTSAGLFLRNVAHGLRMCARTLDRAARSPAPSDEPGYLPPELEREYQSIVASHYEDIPPAAPSVEARDADRESIAQTLWIGFGLHVEKLGFHNDPESALRAASLIAQYAALLPPETP